MLVLFCQYPIMLKYFIFIFWYLFFDLPISLQAQCRLFGLQEWNTRSLCNGHSLFHMGNKHFIHIQGYIETMSLGVCDIQKGTFNQAREGGRWERKVIRGNGKRLTVNNYNTQISK